MTKILVLFIILVSMISNSFAKTGKGEFEKAKKKVLN